MLEAIKVGHFIAEQLEENKLIEFSVAGKKLCVFKTTSAIHAFAATCPHAGAPMCDGWVDARGRIVCPLHGYRFDPVNGRNTSGEGYKLVIYKTEIRDGDLYVFLP